MAIKNLLLLRYLSNLIRKLKFLLSLKANSWILHSLVASQQSPHHQLPIERHPSLLDCAASSELEVFSDACSGPSKAASPIVNVSRTNTPRIGSATPDDIDGRAEIFIANFYRRLCLERQLSLQLCLSGDKPGAGWSPWASPVSPNSFFYFMSKVTVPSPTSPSPFSTAIKISPRPTKSSIKYPDSVPPLKKGRPTIVIHKPPAFYSRSVVRETPK